MVTRLGDGVAGIWKTVTGEIRINFRKGDKGCPLDDLLPQYAKGDGVAGFPLAGYFDYAELWLNTAEQNRQQQARLEKLNLPTGHSAKLPPMPIDILAYGLTTAGEIDYQRITDLFCVIAILWDDGNPTPPIANLLHPLWQSNDYRPHEIAAILMFTSRAQENGGLAETQPVLQTALSVRKI
ncbi:MAG: hypothetical protein N4A53_03085 [Pelagimonas sp.]|jgi:hypothetical protein|nr:hypothetical protein [Pelagimonas sp.]